MFENAISTIFSVIINIIMLPLQLIVMPIDFLLDQIPGIEAIPDAIRAIVSYVGTIPETLVSLFGASPIIWNILFVTFVLFIGLAPAVNAIKKVWAWIRP